MCCGDYNDAINRRKKYKAKKEKAMADAVRATELIAYYQGRISDLRRKGS